MLIAWLTTIVVVSLFVVMFIMFPERPWMAFVMLTGLSVGAFRAAWESEHDLRLYGAYVALAWLLALPFLGIPIIGTVVLGTIFGGGFAVLLGCLFGGGYGLLDALAIPEASGARAWIRATLGVLGLAAACFAGAVVTGVMHFNQLLEPVGVPWLEELLLAGSFLIILANGTFAMFLRRIPDFFRDRATAAYLNRYLGFLCVFAGSALLLTVLLQTGALESKMKDYEQTGPFIARIAYVVLATINLFWLLQCVAAARDDIRPYFRD
jgi:hypothetical protein